VTTGSPIETLEVPRNVDTTYLTHGLFRYVGKLPPPLVAYLINGYSVQGDLVIDPMSGGGTTAIEAVTGGRNAFVQDINPVSLLLSEALSKPCDVEALNGFSESVNAAWKPTSPPEDMTTYFTDDAYGLISTGLRIAKTPVEQALILSIVRRASQANTKKINTVVDPEKSPKAASDLLRAYVGKFVKAFDELEAQQLGNCEVREGNASKILCEDSSAGLVFLHPPYLSNTAFSEVVELQLRLLGHEPKGLRVKELAYRGSYFHVTNGLKKYAIGWAKILEEAARVTKPGGHIAVAIGDGRIDGVRIPLGVMTDEFAKDLGLNVVLSAEHKLNNQTGWTLSRRMTGQHVRVYRK
jgi:site-specific DNA-adenine methylase